jgi:hypothetical protein
MSTNRFSSNTTRSSSMPRFQASDAKKASLDAFILLTRTLASVPSKAGVQTGRRGFALQAATNEHIRMLWPADNRPFVTAALCSAMIDGTIPRKDDSPATRAQKEVVRTNLAGWLDDLVALGVGAEEADAWAAKKATTQVSASAAVGGLAALGRMGQGAPQVAVPVAPAAPAAEDVQAQIAKAVAEATSTQSAQIAALTAQVGQLLNVLSAQVAAPKPSRKAKAKAKAEIVVEAAPEAPETV